MHYSGLIRLRWKRGKTIEHYADGEYADTHQSYHAALDTTINNAADAAIERRLGRQRFGIRWYGEQRQSGRGVQHSGHRQSREWNVDEQ